MSTSTEATERSRPSGPALYVGAFTGFYKPTEEALRDLPPTATFLYAARSVILVISLQAAVIAGLLALTARHFGILDFFLTLIGLVCVHAISNLSNDYFGHMHGHDTADSPRRRYTVHPIASGAISARTLRNGIAALCLAAAAIAAYFVATRGWIALGFVLAGAILLFAYDAAPVTLKSIGLGEIASFLVWGPLMVEGGYYVISGHLSGPVAFDSVPYGLGVMSILVGKHIDQLEFDLGAHQNTLPVLLGEARARLLNRLCVVAMYAVIVAAVAVGWLTPFALLAFVAAPRARRALAVMSQPRPVEAPAGYVGWPLWYHRACLVHNRLFGWAFIIGLAIGAALPGVHF